MKNKIKLIPVDIMNIFEMEAYLSHMAAKGYLLKKLGNLGHFEKAEPQKMTYHLAPFIEAGMSADKQLENYQRCNWTYVCAIGKIFNVYRCAEENPTEIVEEPTEIIKRYEIILHNLKGILWLTGISFLMYVILIFFDGLLDETKILSAVKYGTWWYMIVVLISTITSLRSMIKTRTKLKEIINKLKLGILSYEKVDYKEMGDGKYIKRYITQGIYIAILVITMACLINDFTGGWEKSISSYDAELPILRLEEIEQDANFTLTHHIYNNKDYDDRITYEKSGLASRIYEIEQSGEVKGKTWEGGAYRPWIETEFYEVRLKELAKPLVNDLIHDKVKFYRDTISAQELEDTGFDEAIYVQVGQRQMLFIRLGKKVMYTCYEGEQNMRRYIKEIHDLIETF